MAARHKHLAQLGNNRHFRVPPEVPSRSVPVRIGEIGRAVAGIDIGINVSTRRIARNEARDREGNVSAGCA